MRSVRLANAMPGKVEAGLQDAIVDIFELLSSWFAFESPVII
jgi:hypothetical protein